MEQTDNRASFIEQIKLQIARLEEDIIEKGRQIEALKAQIIN
jgi:hypothetical protein